ncbi:MAG TPA: hypothetical protein VFZ89_00955 [Solirubrobacteraceae bacterium]
MSLRRWRTGEWLAAAGAVALVALLFLDWFEAEARADRASGWASLGWPLVAWLVLTVLAAAWLLWATAAVAAVSQIMVAAVLCVVAALVALVATVVRVTLAQPALGAGLADDEVGVALPGYLGPLAVAAILAGAWRAMADERTTAPESAYTPPPARPAPPADA